MKTPRGVSADRLIRALERIGYNNVRLRHDGPPILQGGERAQQDDQCAANHEEHPGAERTQTGHPTEATWL